MAATPSLHLSDLGVDEPVPPVTLPPAVLGAAGGGGAAGNSGSRELEKARFTLAHHPPTDVRYDPLTQRHSCVIRASHYTDHYDVSIGLGGGGGKGGARTWSEWSCNCPQGSGFDEACKHVLAFFLFLIDQQNQPHQTASVAPAASKASLPPPTNATAATTTTAAAGTAQPKPAPAPLAAASARSSRPPPAEPRPSVMYAPSSLRRTGTGVTPPTTAAAPSPREAAVAAATARAAAAAASAVSSRAGVAAKPAPAPAPAAAHSSTSRAAAAAPSSSAAASPPMVAPPASNSLGSATSSALQRSSLQPSEASASVKLAPTAAKHAAAGGGSSSAAHAHLHLHPSHSSVPGPSKATLSLGNSSVGRAVPPSSFWRCDMCAQRNPGHLQRCKECQAIRKYDAAGSGSATTAAGTGAAGPITRWRCAFCACDNSYAESPNKCRICAADNPHPIPASTAAAASTPTASHASEHGSAASAGAHKPGASSFSLSLDPACPLPAAAAGGGAAATDIAGIAAVSAEPVSWLQPGKRAMSAIAEAASPLELDGSAAGGGGEPSRRATRSSAAAAAGADANETQEEKERRWSRMLAEAEGAVATAASAAAPGSSRKRAGRPGAAADAASSAMDLTGTAASRGGGDAAGGAAAAVAPKPVSVVRFTKGRGAHATRLQEAVVVLHHRSDKDEVKAAEAEAAAEDVAPEAARAKAEAVEKAAASLRKPRVKRTGVATAATATTPTKAEAPTRKAATRGRGASAAVDSAATAERNTQPMDLDEGDDAGNDKDAAATAPAAPATLAEVAAAAASRMLHGNNSHGNGANAMANDGWEHADPDKRSMPSFLTAPKPKRATRRAAASSSAASKAATDAKMADDDNDAADASAAAAGAPAKRKRGAAAASSTKKKAAPRTTRAKKPSSPAKPKQKLRRRVKGDSSDSNTESEQSEQEEDVAVDEEDDDLPPLVPPTSTDGAAADPTVPFSLKPVSRDPATSDAHATAVGDSSKRSLRAALVPSAGSDKSTSAAAAVSEASILETLHGARAFLCTVARDVAGGNSSAAADPASNAPAADADAVAPPRRKRRMNLAKMIADPQKLFERLQRPPGSTQEDESQGGGIIPGPLLDPEQEGEQVMAALLGGVEDDAPGPAAVKPPSRQSSRLHAPALAPASGVPPAAAEGNGADAKAKNDAAVPASSQLDMEAELAQMLHLTGGEDHVAGAAAAAAASGPPKPFKFKAERDAEAAAAAAELAAKATAEDAPLSLGMEEDNSAVAAPAATGVENEHTAVEELQEASEAEEEADEDAEAEEGDEVAVSDWRRVDRRSTLASRLLKQQQKVAATKKAKKPKPKAARAPKAKCEKAEADGPAASAAPTSRRAAVSAALSLDPAESPQHPPSRYKLASTILDVLPDVPLSEAADVLARCEDDTERALQMLVEGTAAATAAAAKASGAAASHEHSKPKNCASVIRNDAAAERHLRGTDARESGPSVSTPSVRRTASTPRKRRRIVEEDSQEEADEEEDGFVAAEATSSPPAAFPAATQAELEDALGAMLDDGDDIDMSPVADPAAVVPRSAAKTASGAAGVATVAATAAAPDAADELHLDSQLGDLLFADAPAPTGAPPPWTKAEQKESVRAAASSSSQAPKLRRSKGALSTAAAVEEASQFYQSDAFDARMASESRQRGRERRERAQLARIEALSALEEADKEHSNARKAKDEQEQAGAEEKDAAMADVGGAVDDIHRTEQLLERKYADEEQEGAEDRKPAETLSPLGELYTFATGSQQPQPHQSGGSGGGSAAAGGAAESTNFAPSAAVAAPVPPSWSRRKAHGLEKPPQPLPLPRLLQQRQLQHELSLLQQLKAQQMAEHGSVPLPPASSSRSGRKPSLRREPRSAGVAAAPAAAGLSASPRVPRSVAAALEAAEQRDAEAAAAAEAALSASSSTRGACASDAHDASAPTSSASVPPAARAPLVIGRRSDVDVRRTKRRKVT